MTVNASGPWLRCDEDRNRQFLAELDRELHPGHLLFGRAVRAVMARIDRDDVLFELNHGTLAVVHLTWARERDPRWPSTRIYTSYDQFVQEVLIPDQREYEGDHEA